LPNKERNGNNPLPTPSNNLVNVSDTLFLRQEMSHLGFIIDR
jgi:hypothetical protein